MNIEQKKKLAEFMGWTLEYTQSQNCVINKGTGAHQQLRNWNPDTNPEQFKEVWKNLTIDQIREVFIILGVNTMDSAMFYFPSLLLNEPHKVINAVLEVI